MKILIAEDDAVTRRMLQRTLEKWGYQVVSAKDGVEAFEAFKQEDFSLVISDWVMPEMNGLELVAKIRSLQLLEYVYIIMLTAKSGKEDLISGMDSGADDFVSKPFDKDELRVRLRAGARVINLEKKLSLRNAALEKANDRMRVDLEAAAGIQKSLLPSVALKGDKFESAFRFKPCDELAGDILNIFTLDQNHVGFYVLDVSGHGVPAALLAVTLSRILSPELDQSSLIKRPSKTETGFTLTSPQIVANQLNKRFQIDPESGQFFTMLYGILNIDSKVLRYVSSGHPGIIYISKSGGQTLNVASLPIGFLEDNEYEESTIQLSSGDRVYLYSDGLPEAENPGKELFGIPRMQKTLEKCTNMSIGESLDNLLQCVEDWSDSPSLKDDATLLGLEIK